ncbi:MAG: mechanosensitive ion channel [Alphaproteobacteria bacterium]|nr:mechanosensitive ion channel [Alphaproteobacteria bacterium]
MRLLSLLFGALLLVLAGAAGAQDLDPAHVRAQLVEHERGIDRLGREIGSLKLTESGIQRLNAQALQVKGEVERLRSAAGTRADEQRGLLEALGKPTEGQAEAADVAQQRKALADAVAEADGWVHQGDLILAKVEQVLDRLSTKRIEALARTLSEVKPIPVDPRNWLRALSELGQILDITRVSVHVWILRNIDEPGVRGAAGFVLLLAVVGIAIGLVAARGLARAAAPLGLAWGAEPAPEAAATRMLAALVAWIGRVAPWAIGGVLAYRGLPDEALLPNAVARAIGGGAVLGVAVFFGLYWLIRLTLAVERPAWRVPALDDARAQALRRALIGLAAIVAVDWGVVRAASSFEYVDAFIALWGLLATAAIAWSVVMLRRRSGWSGGHGWTLLRSLAALAAMLAVPVAAVGFSTLAQYLALGVVGSGAVLGAASAARHAVREGLPRVLTPGSRIGDRILSGLALGPDVLRLVEFWLSLALELVIVALIVVGLLLVWGATPDDIVVFWARLLEGVRIGSYTFSLADLLLSSVVFFAAVSITRYLQRVLDTRVFPRTTLDVGVRHSLRSGLGYVGLVVAATMAVSTLGLNISNLAFVAGALTVGIGFGLQNIVNNFVSGLILLVERPIKQGDWVVVGANQGIVKRINVRATEIETFSRSTILVPNAEFLQTHVVNWTHKDTSARVDVTITIPQYRGDAASLREMLLGCVRQRSDVLAHPPPIVLLKDLTADAYVFDVFCFTSEALRRGFIASELRFAIDAALRAR